MLQLMLRGPAPITTTVRSASSETYNEMSQRGKILLLLGLIIGPVALIPQGILPLIFKLIGDHNRIWFLASICLAHGSGRLSSACSPSGWRCSTPSRACTSCIENALLAKRERLAVSAGANVKAVQRMLGPATSVGSRSLPRWPGVSGFPRRVGARIRRGAARAIASRWRFAPAAEFVWHDHRDVRDDVALASVPRAYVVLSAFAVAAVCVAASTQARDSHA
jgi:hypothetical protein